MYTASISWFIGLLSSICSISISCSVPLHPQASPVRNVLVTFSFRMSSSLTTLSTSRLLPASKTTTFHCKGEGLSLMVFGSRTGTAYFSSSCRPHGLKNDCDIRSNIMRSVFLTLRTFLLYRDCRGSHGCGMTGLCCGVRGSDPLSSRLTATIFKLSFGYLETCLDSTNVDSNSYDQHVAPWDPRPA